MTPDIKKAEKVLSRVITAITVGLILAIGIIWALRHFEKPVVVPPVILAPVAPSIVPKPPFNGKG